MKLRNKKTGEIVDVESLGHADSLKEKFGYQVTLSWKIDEHLDTCKTYNSLAELNEEWEDYEEPKEYCYITSRGNFHFIEDIDDEGDKERKEIGNYFETEEEAEKALEKLKAWKRLKDGGFVFCGKGDCLDTIKFDYGEAGYNNQDFNLLFGGEE